MLKWLFFYLRYIARITRSLFYFIIHFFKSTTQNIRKAYVFFHIAMSEVKRSTNRLNITSVHFGTITPWWYVISSKIISTLSHLYPWTYFELTYERRLDLLYLMQYRSIFKSKRLFVIKSVSINSWFLPPWTDLDFTCAFQRL